jgi:hypothetical protein
MAQITVRSSGNIVYPGGVLIINKADPASGPYWIGECTNCAAEIGHRGRLEDALEEARRHVDAYPACTQ